MNAVVSIDRAREFPRETLFQTVKSRLGELKAERQSFESHWKDLQEFFLTRRGRWITDSKQSLGQKRNQKLIDPTPKLSARTLGAGMHAGSTNPSSIWFKLSTINKRLMQQPGVAAWLYEVENVMRDIFARSNLYSVLPSCYNESGVFGTAPILMLENADTTIHFVPKTVGSYYVAANSLGVIDTLYCEYQMTTRQMVDDFGLQAVSESIRNEWFTGKRHVSHQVLHAIEPNTDRQAGLRDNQNMAFRSVYFDPTGSDDQRPLRLSGFEDNPIACFRWETTEITDPYGSSCGMDALGCAQAIQVQHKQKAKAIDKLVDPPMVGDPALKGQPSSLLPGDVTYAGFTPTGASPKFQPAYVINPKIQELILDLQDTRELVEKCMYTDLFLAITMADPRNATVPEIDARKEEQILSLGPVLQNQNDGLLKPIIDRTFNIAMRQGRFPPPPPALSNQPIRVEFTGALAQAFRAIAAGKIERFTGFVGSVAKAQADSGQEVTAFDKWDADQSIDEYAEALGVPPTIVRSDEDVEELRAQRAEQQQAQQAAASAQPIKDASIAAKNLSETEVEGQSALDAMMEQM